MSISVVKLLVLPVWGTVSTSGLYLILFSKVEQCWYLWKWIGHDRKLCRSRWHHVDISSRHQLITTSASVRHLVFTSEEVPDMAGVGMTEKFANENRWNLVSSWHRTWDTAGGGVIYTPLLATCVVTNTLAIGGLMHDDIFYYSSTIFFTDKFTWAATDPGAEPLVGDQEASVSAPEAESFLSIFIQKVAQS